MRQNRGPWYLFTGLALGLAAGLMYAWLVEPVQYIDAAPAGLSAPARDGYRALIALAYLADGNLGRARQRLALLNDSSPAQALAAQAQRAEPGSAEARALAALANAYNPKPTQAAAADASPTPTPSPTSQPSRAPTGLLSPTPTLDPQLAVRSATPIPSQTPTITPTITLTPTITPTLIASVTLRPTLRPTATLGAPYAVKDSQRNCDRTQPGLLTIEVLNGAGQPVPGAQIRVSWPPAGRDIFYTGLMLEIGPGYADFQMEPGNRYSVQVGENGEPATGVTITDCTAADGPFAGGWKLRFAQP